MRLYSFFFLIGLILTFQININAVFADQNSFTSYMLEWREKSELAERYLKEAESELRLGSKYKACLKQRLASKTGIEAFNALVNAQNLSKEDGESSLNDIAKTKVMWKKLENCNTDNLLLK